MQSQTLQSNLKCGFFTHLIAIYSQPSELLSESLCHDYPYFIVSTTLLQIGGSIPYTVFISSILVRL
jgi:hypothetical protein